MAQTGTRTTPAVRRLILALVLGAVLLGSIVLFAVLRQRTEDVNVDVTVRATATARAAPVIVATPLPTATLRPTQPAAPATAPAAPTVAPTAVVPPPAQAAPPTAAPTLPPAPTLAPTAPPAPAPTTPAQPAAPPVAPTQPPAQTVVVPVPTLAVPAPLPTAAGAPPTAGQPAPTVAPKPTAPPAGPTPVPSSLPTTAQVVPGQEATLRCPDSRIVLTVRAGTISQPVTLACQMIDPGSVPGVPGQLVEDLVFQLSANGNPAGALPAEVNLGISYGESPAAAQGEQQLTIGSLEAGQWRPVPRVATDPPNNHVSATIDRLGVYALYRPR